MLGQIPTDRCVQTLLYPGCVLPHGALIGQFLTTHSLMFKRKNELNIKEHSLRGNSTKQLTVSCVQLGFIELDGVNMTSFCRQIVSRISLITRQTMLGSQFCWPIFPFKETYTSGKENILLIVQLLLGAARSSQLQQRVSRRLTTCSLLSKSLTYKQDFYLHLPQFSLLRDQLVQRQGQQMDNIFSQSF